MFKFVPVLTGGAIITSDNNLIRYVNSKQAKFEVFNLIDLFTLKLKSILIKFLTNKIIFSFLTFHIFKFGEVNNIKWIVKFTKNDPNPFSRKNLDNFEKHRLNKFQIYCLKKGFINIENYRRIREKNFNILFKFIKSNKIKLLTPNNFTKHS